MKTGVTMRLWQTTRPETIMGDTAMCINPKDPKNAWLKGRRVIVPLVGREVPVIEDRYVDIEFGTGCLKVTPAHDKNDYMLGKKHGLESIDIFNEDGTVAEVAGMYVGFDRFDCRKAIAKDPHCRRSAGERRRLHQQYRSIGAHKGARGAASLAPVVREDEALRRREPAARTRRHYPLRPRKV